MKTQQNKESTLTEPTIFAIVAIQPDGGIGFKNDLIFEPGELFGDMKNFRDLTTEAGIVHMGRKTWDSFPEKFKPLPNRINSVVSRNPWEANHPKVHLFTDPVTGLVQLRALYPEKSIAVIGGGEIYKKLFPYCEYIYCTEAKCENRPADVSIEIPHPFREIKRVAKGFDNEGIQQGIPWDLVIYKNYNQEKLPVETIS
jgi:dihydrofolate reductase